MKHNLLKSLIISVILLMGVSNAWAGNNIAFQNGAHFYFDPYYNEKQTVDKGYVQLAVRKYQNSGHDDYGWYTGVTTLSKINNTRLYYTSTFEGPSWNDQGLSFHGWAMISNSTAKGNGDTEYWTGSNSTWYSEFKNYGLNKNSTYLFVATSASNGQSIQPNGTGYLEGGYSALNSQQTIKSAVNGDDANSKATISITSYKMTDNGQVTQQTATLGTGAKDSYVTAARTATTTLTVGTVATGYQFDGWYTAATGGTALSTSTTYTYYPTAATTVYARFSAQPSTTIYLEPTGYWNSDNPQYVAHVWNTSVNKDITMIGVGDSPHRYYKAEVPYGYTNVVFYRKSTNGATIWNQTADLQFPTNDNVLYTITSTGTYKKGDDGYEAAGGNWKVANLVYTVTLAGTDYGTYKVTYGEQQPITVSNQTRIIDVAAGTQLTITNIVPKTDGYDQTMVYNTGEYTEFDDYEEDNQGNRTYTYTVTSDVTIAEDFRTKEAHTIFVKVPKGNASAYWEGLRIIPMNGVTQSKAGTDASVNEFAEHMKVWQNIDEYILYYFTIPAGNHSFILYPANNTTASSIFWYEILPKDGKKDINQNCWVINNTTDNTKANGTWVASKVYLDPCKYGTYGIRCNGQEYYNYADNPRIVELPFGAVLEPIDAVSTSPHYGPNPRYASSIVINEYFEVDLNTSLTLIDQIRYSANLVTTQPHRVILHIPNDILSDWNAGVPYNCVYAKDYRSYRSCQFDEASQTYIGKLIEGTKLGSEEYYYFDIPAGFNNFVFERKNSLGEGVGPHRATNDFLYQIPLDENLVYTLTGTDSSGKFIGTWGPLPEYTITLGYPDIGRFGIIVDGETIYASNQNKRDTYITVPYGTEVQLLKGEPGDAAYTTNLVKVINNVKEHIIFGESENQRTFTITSDVKFDDIFATKDDQQTVFIAVPKNHANLGKWYTCSDANHNTYGHDVYVYQSLHPYDYPKTATRVMKKKVGTIETDDYTYYQFTLDAHVYYLNFQFKSAIDANGTWDTNAAHAGTIYSWCPPISTKNCFYLDGEIDGTNHVSGYKGYWGTKPNVGDYRVLYAEKELIKTHEEGETEDWETAFRTVYEHPSDIIKQTLGTASKNTVSLHITTTQERDGKTVHPMVILQQFQRIEGNTYDWVNLQAHTVLRLKATGNMGMLPGRKKAFGDLPFYDDGIEVIKNDTQYEDCTDDKGNSYKGSGVWNFVVNQASDGSVELDLSQTKRYQGEYYIRTNNAPGIWDQYTDNEITYSSYAEQYSGFSHYYCKWVDLSKHSEDVSFVIANDHATNLTDPSKLFEDQYITDEKLTENANVRWGWEHMTNKVSRAYIRGTWDTNEPPARIENIVVDYTPSEVDAPEQKLLYDSGDWIYSINLEDMKVGSKLNTLTAKYPSNGYTQTFAENINMLVGDYDNTKSYIVRILYDFKIDKTLVALVPNKNEATVGIDVLIERIDQGPATQVVAQVNSKKNNNEGSTVYGAFTFTQPHLTDTKLSEQEKLTYWFSFPFDVLLSDVYGFGEVGKYWMIKEYDGKSRAKEGLTEDNTFWKFITKKSTVLQANKGYVLTLNKRLMNEDDVVYTNTDSICLYFPSQNLVTSIDNGFTVEEDQVIEIPQWTGETAKKEWNWNLIGIPSYANKEETITADHLYYFFDYRHSNDTYEVMYLGDHTFKSTFAYMVQFAGDINWHTFKTTPKQLAAQKDASAEINHVMRLELLRNNQREDKTYIQLTENENATEQFDMNFDLTKMANAKANLYSLIGNHQLAANVLPLQTTVVPLGVIIKTAGEYTFSMPEGTDGIVVELIDYETNTRTNLLLDNYTVTLPAGTNNSRFALSLQPDKTVTSVDNIGNEATGDKVKKYLIDGVLYMQKDGVLYDAQGKLVR